MTPLVEEVAKAVRRAQFKRTSTGRAYDETVPPTEVELLNAEAAIAEVLKAMRYYKLCVEPLANAPTDDDREVAKELVRPRAGYEARSLEHDILAAFDRIRAEGEAVGWTEATLAERETERWIELHSAACDERDAANKLLCEAFDTLDPLGYHADLRFRIAKHIDERRVK